ISKSPSSYAYSELHLGQLGKDIKNLKNSTIAFYKSISCLKPYLFHGIKPAKLNISLVPKAVSVQSHGYTLYSLLLAAVIKVTCSCSAIFRICCNVFAC